MRCIPILCAAALLLPSGCCAHRARTTATSRMADAPRPEDVTGVDGKSRPRTDPLSGGASQAPVDGNERITVEFKETPIHEVLAWIAEHVQKTIVVDAGIEDKISVNFQKLHYREAIERAADLARCVVRMNGARFIVEKPPRVTMEFKRADLGEVIHTLAKHAGATVIVDPDVKGEVTMRFTDVPWMRALSAVVKTAGYELMEEDGGRVLRVGHPSMQPIVMYLFFFEHMRPDTYLKARITSNGVGRPPSEKPKPFTLLQAFENMLTRPPGAPRDAPIGRLEYDAAANAMIVWDQKRVADDMRRLIQAIDVPPTR